MCWPNIGVQRSSVRWKWVCVATCPRRAYQQGRHREYVPALRCRHSVCQWDGTPLACWFQRAAYRVTCDTRRYGLHLHWSRILLQFIMVCARPLLHVSISFCLSMRQTFGWHCTQTRTSILRCRCSMVVRSHCGFSILTRQFSWTTWSLSYPTA